MRLRDSIRPPKRFNSEEFETPYSEINLRRPNITTEKPHIIEYNPNHPPAAFPTLDRPRVPGSNDENIANNQDENDSEVDFEDISFDDIDNLQASNGPLNPIYVRNMNLMADAGGASSHADPIMQDTDLDFEDSDEDLPLASDSTALSPALSQGPQMSAEQSLTTSQPAIPDPEWKDFPAALRVEIFSNLLQSYDWSDTCRKLGLDANESKRVRAAWAERDKQIHDEDAMLGKMRAQQLRELMRVDNSLPNQDSQLLQRSLRKDENKTFRGLKKKPQMKYLICNSNDIALARRFLVSRGLSVRLIGEWCNSIPVTNDLAETDDDTDDSGNPSSSTGSSTTDGNDSPSTKAPRIKFINCIRSATSVSSARHESVAVKSPTQNSSQPSQSSQPNSLVSLKVGREQAAQIQSTARPAIIDPFQLFDLNHPLDCVSGDPTPTGEDATIDIPGVPAPVPSPAPARVTRPGPQEPVRRIMGGTWSYLSAGLNQTRMNNSTRRRGQEKVSSTGNGEASSDAKKKEAMLDPGSSEQRIPCPPPGQNFLHGPRPKHIGSSGVQFLNAIDEIPTLTSESETLSANIEMSEAASPVLPRNTREKSDDRTITPPTSDDRSTVEALASEIANELDMTDVGMNHDDTEEDEMEPDEMVLVPSAASD